MLTKMYFSIFFHLSFIFLKPVIIWSLPSFSILIWGWNFLHRLCRRLVFPCLFPSSLSLQALFLYCCLSLLTVLWNSLFFPEFFVVLGFGFAPLLGNSHSLTFWCSFHGSSGSLLMRFKRSKQFLMLFFKMACILSRSWKLVGFHLL